MATTLFAQSYDLPARGFYFTDVNEYEQKASTARSDYGDPVEKFELTILVGECGFGLDYAQSGIDLEIYEIGSMRAFAATMTGLREN